jgi:hypothetical protein
MSPNVVKKRDLSHLTQDEIEKHASQGNSNEHLRLSGSCSPRLGITILYDFGNCTIKRYPDNTVIKSGRKTRLKSEAAALRFATKIGLPTARIHDINESSCDGNNDMKTKR